jgi:hypothetical protein
MTQKMPVGPAEGHSTGRPGRNLVLLLVLIVFPLLVITAFLSSLAALSHLGNLQQPSPPTLGRGNSSPSELTIPVNFTARSAPTQVNLPSIPSSLVTESLAILAVLLTAYIVVRAFRNRAQELAFATQVDVLTEKRREEVSEILDATAAKLTLGSDYRQVVLRCYKLIAEVLEEDSKIDGRTLTAREFRRSVSEKLKLDSPYLPKATELFEVARYSTEEIGRSQALEAAECLSNLSRSLKEAPSVTASSSQPQRSGRETSRAQQY